MQNEDGKQLVVGRFRNEFRFGASTTVEKLMAACMEAIPIEQVYALREINGVVCQVPVGRIEVKFVPNVAPSHEVPEFDPGPEPQQPQQLEMVAEEEPYEPPAPPADEEISETELEKTMRPIKTNSPWYRRTRK